MKTYPDRDTIEKFLKEIITFGNFWEIRYFHNEEKYRKFFKNDGKLEKRIAKYIVGHKDANNFDWYIGIFPRDIPKGTSDAISQCHLLYFDFDDYNLVKNISLFIQDLRENFLEPSIVAVSGRGVHVYYKIEPIDKETWRKTQKVVGGELKKKYDKLDIFIDPTRISRIIGTWNYKSNKPTFLSFVSKKVYKIEELKNLFKF